MVKVQKFIHYNCKSFRTSTESIKRKERETISEDLKMVKQQTTCNRLKDLINIAEIPSKGSEDLYQQYNNSTASNLAKQIKK